MPFAWKSSLSREEMDMNDNQDIWKTLIQNQKDTAKLLKELTNGIKELSLNFRELSQLLKDLLGKKETSNYIG